MFASYRIHAFWISISIVTRCLVPTFCSLLIRCSVLVIETGYCRRGSLCGLAASTGYILSCKQWDCAELGWYGSCVGPCFLQWIEGIPCACFGFFSHLVYRTFILFNIAVREHKVTEFQNPSTDRSYRMQNFTDRSTSQSLKKPWENGITTIFYGYSLVYIFF